MGISDGFEGGGSGCEVDCSVGTIVWVRRRNGSWWPGRILGPEELSASHLMSPRSGTPVKLLGREDASVDWYNLEKSKRVKTFRCGEFDDCIDKAEKSQGAAIKKREKYARREDAILHALELERQQVEKKHQKLGIVNCLSSKSPPVLKKELVAPPERVGYDHGKLVNLKAQSLSKGLGSSLEEESTENHLYAQKEKFVKLPSGVKDNSEALPRMKGLQDFGLRNSSSKRKLSASEGSCKAFSDDNHVPGLPSGSQRWEGANHVNSSRNTLAVKRKTQGTENSLVKRRDRRRPLVQILQSSAKLPVSHSLKSDGDVSLSVQGEKEQMGVLCRAKRSRCVYLPADSNDLLDHTDLSSDEMQRLPSQFGMDNGHRTPGSSTEENTSSGVMDEAESDSSEKDYLNPEMDEEMAVLSDLTHTMTGAEPRISKRYMTNFHVQGQTESMSSEDLDESAVNGYMPHLHPHDQIAAGAADVGVSKWQLKGKRNTRNLMKRPMEKGSNGSIYAAYLEGKRNSLKKRSLGQTLYHGHDALNYDYDEDELIEKKPTQTQLSGFSNRRYPSVLKGFGMSTTDTIDSEDDSVWEAEGPSQTPFRGYWDESAKLDPVYAGHRLGNGKKSMLVDVDLQVRSSYQGERVPLVSLMSRLNGKAIVGHPVQIEVLEDGSTAALFSSLDDSSGEPMGNNESTSLKPVWRTARRTAMHRIPRPHPSTTLNEEGGGPSQYSDLEVKPLHKKPHSENPYQKARKSFRYPEKRFSKKPIKKVSLLNQKTRTLSLIAIDHKIGGKACNSKHENKSGSLDGLIKPENGPLACIPVKIVFSRLMEAVGRPPSRLPNHSTVNGDTEKKPS